MVVRNSRGPRAPRVAGDGTYIVTVGLFVVGLSMIGRGYTQKKRDRRAEGVHYTQPPEWYPDPRDPAMLRWWDGHGWTAETRPAD